MNEKKKQMIQVGMKLFAEKGFYTTSIQEIAEQSGVSKGAFYLYFQSKQDFVMEIYKYYHEKMKTRLAEINQQHFSNPMEKFATEIQVYFEEFLEHKEFIIMHFRENFPMHKEVQGLINKIRMDHHNWYKHTLLTIYGKKIKPFLLDGIIITEGLLDSYMKTMLFEVENVDLKQLSTFLVRRIDDVIKSMVEKEKVPLLTEDMLQPFYQKGNKYAKKEEIHKLLLEIKACLPQIQVDSKTLTDLEETVNILLKEIKKEEPQKVILQGMLSNLQGVESLTEYRKKIEAVIK